MTYTTEIKSFTYLHYITYYIYTHTYSAKYTKWLPYTVRHKKATLVWEIVCIYLRSCRYGWDVYAVMS